MVRRKTPVPEPRNVDKETIYVVSILTLEKKPRSLMPLFFQLVLERCNLHICAQT